MGSATTSVRRVVGSPVLRPGLRVFRRDDAHLQVGIDHPRLVLPDNEGVRRLLRDLELGEGLVSLTPETGLVLDRLVEAGLVVERADVTAALHGERRGTASVAFAAHGPEAPMRLAARATCRVGVTAPEPWSTAVNGHLALAGLHQVAADDRPRVTLVVSVGEPARSRLDLLVRDDLAHLMVTLLPDRARLGPFVVPGATACVRCIDAHLAEADPRRGLVLEQLEDHPGPPPPCDPVLAQAATALAVHELTSYAEADRPATWSATVDLAGGLTFPHRAWSRHPHCGCSWW